MDTRVRACVHALACTHVCVRAGPDMHAHAREPADFCRDRGHP